MSLQDTVGRVEHLPECRESQGNCVHLREHVTVELMHVQRLDLALAVGECYGALGTEEVCLAEAIHRRLARLESELEATRQKDVDSAAQARHAAPLKVQRHLVGKVCCWVPMQTNPAHGQFNGWAHDTTSDPGSCGDAPCQLYCHKRCGCVHGKEHKQFRFR